MIFGIGGRKLFTHIRPQALRKRLRDALPKSVRLKSRSIRQHLIEVSRFVSTLGATVITSIVPTRFDKIITEHILEFYCKLKPKRIARGAEKKISLLSSGIAEQYKSQAHQISIDYYRMRIEIRWQQPRAIGLRPSVPETELTGFEHVEKALDKGCGAILWRMSFTSAAPVNAALAASGQPLVHLSSTYHLASTQSWFSANVVGRLLCVDELRFLKKRVISEQGKTTGYLDQLRDTLNNNELVSIVGDVSRGRIQTSVVSGGSTIRVPSGATSLARSTGAALLPCAAVRVGAFKYQVIIFPDVAPDVSLDKRAFRKLAIERYASDREVVLNDHIASYAYF